MQTLDKTTALVEVGQAGRDANRDRSRHRAVLMTAITIAIGLMLIAAGLAIASG